MRLPSIRQRLARALLAALLGWGLLAVPLVGLVLHQAVDAVLDSTMQDAAHAFAEGLVLVTHNTHHFERVPRLAVEDWLA